MAITRCLYACVASPSVLLCFLGRAKEDMEGICDAFLFSFSFLCVGGGGAKEVVDIRCKIDFMVTPDV